MRTVGVSLVSVGVSLVSIVTVLAETADRHPLTLNLTLSGQEGVNLTGDLGILGGIHLSVPIAKGIQVPSLNVSLGDPSPASPSSNPAESGTTRRPETTVTTTTTTTTTTSSSVPPVTTTASTTTTTAATTTATTTTTAAAATTTITAAPVPTVTPTPTSSMGSLARLPAPTTSWSRPPPSDDPSVKVLTTGAATVSTVTVLSSPTVQTVFAEPPVPPAMKTLPEQKAMDLLPTEFLHGPPSASKLPVTDPGSLTVTPLSTPEIKTVEGGKATAKEPSASIKVETVVVSPPEIPVVAGPPVKNGGGDPPPPARILRVVSPPLTKDDLSAPLFPPTQPKPVRIFGDLTTAWIAARASFLEAIKRPFVYISNMWKVDLNSDVLDEEDDGGHPSILQVQYEALKRSTRSVDDEPGHDEPYSLKDRSLFSPQDVQKLQDQPSGHAQTAMDECGALLIGMTTSVCGRFEKYTIRSCSNDTDVCSNLAQQDLVRLMGICSKPTLNVLCKMSNRVEPSPKCKFTTCNIYDFSIGRIIDQTTGSCSSQIESLSNKLLN